MPQHITANDRRFSVWTRDDGYSVYPKTPDRNPLFFSNEWTVEEITAAVAEYLDGEWPEEQRREIDDGIYEGVDEEARL